MDLSFKKNKMIIVESRDGSQNIKLFTHSFVTPTPTLRDQKKNKLLRSISKIARTKMLR